MRSADPRASEIIRTIGEFDASVAAAESALVARDWPQIDTLLSDQHRLTHALANLLDATRDERPQAFSDEVDRRLAQISARREDQLRRLIAFNHLVKERLTIISRAREMRREARRTAHYPEFSIRCNDGSCGGAHVVLARAHGGADGERNRRQIARRLDAIRDSPLRPDQRPNIQLCLSSLRVVFAQSARHHSSGKADTNG